MKHLFKQLIYGGVVLAPAFLLTGCIVDDYDSLDNIDLTVGLGSDGLGVRLGNTEKIYLDDILSVDESVKLDHNNLYYLVESGSSDFDVTIDPLTVDLNIPSLGMKMNVLEYAAVRNQFLEHFPGIPVPDGLPIPILKNSEFVPTGLADSKKTESTFTVNDISADVKRINWVGFDATEVTLKLHQDKSNNVKFGLKQLNNVVITLPKELHVTEYPTATWKYDEKAHTLTQIGDLVLQGSDLNICRVKIDRADVNAVINENHSVTINSDITMKGDVDFYVTEDFNMVPGDYVTIELEFVHTNDLNIREVNGRFNPNVEQETTRIDIFDDLPDFLQDEGVTVSVSNPTLKFNAQLQQIPIAFNFGATLEAVKTGEGAFNNKVTLPQVAIENNRETTVYYYQGAKPYDPDVNQIPANAQQKQVANLSSLIKTLPDYINVDLGNNQIGVLQDRDFTLQMGHTYRTSAVYDIYVPFEFDHELTIVYKDSTNSFGEDLEDYAAHGVRVSAKIQNTIPLALKLTLKAVDANGKEIPGVNFTPLTVKAGTGDVNSPVEEKVSIEGTLSDPYLLRKIDHIVFDVKADGSQNGDQVHQLMSTQYLRLADVSIHLTGQVIADFN